MTIYAGLGAGSSVWAEAAVRAAEATPVPPAPSGAAGRSHEEQGACHGDGPLSPRCLLEATAAKSSL